MSDLDFADRSHFEQLSKSLWRWPYSNAAVMVGAGFSMNSRKLAGVRRNFPSWNDLGKRMYDELNPADSAYNKIDPTERAIQIARANPLTLASEYEANFCRSSLDNLLREEIPDQDFEPAELHELLLKLPWKDVFTTNYDSLLERTVISEKAYHPVQTAQDLTRADSPRIVKLHGSIPASTKLIITEDDFRTYPQKYATFVNSVQQSLIENCFVLIGFSGDDPNFLAWTGWIRDNLAEHRPIYLVGAHGFDDARRKLLDSRGVTPIDLFPLFKHLKDRPNEMHPASLQWFLQSLRSQEPIQPEEWPKIPSRVRYDPVEGVPILSSEVHKVDEIELQPSREFGSDPEEIAKVIGAWRDERIRYPKWLTLSPDKCTSIWLASSRWFGPLLEGSKTLTLDDRLTVCFEVCWRLETAMAPLTNEWFKIVEKTIDEILNEPSQLNLNGFLTQRYNLDKSEIISNLLKVCLFLLQDHRESSEFENWENLLERIKKKLTNHISLVQDDLTYEEIYFKIWTLRSRDGSNQISQWQPQRGNLLATMRKGGLLAEMGETEESVALLSEALIEIRQRLLKQRRSIELLSLEGWCMFLLHQVETSNCIRHGNPFSTKYFSRFRMLRRCDCDPQAHLETLKLSLEKKPPEFGSKGQKFDFDRGTITHDQVFHFDTLSKRLPAFSYIRLFERVGLPMRLAFLETSSALRQACEWINDCGYLVAPLLLARSGKHKVFEQSRLFQRYHLICLDETHSQSVISWALSALERELSDLQQQGNLSHDREGVTVTIIELTSRLTIRMDEDQLEKAYQLAFRAHHHPVLQPHESVVKKSYSLVERLMEVASTEQYSRWGSEILVAPLPSKSRNPWLKIERPKYDLAETLDNPDRDPYLESWPIEEMIQYFEEYSRSPDPLTVLSMIERAAWLRRRAKPSAKLLTRLSHLFWKQDPNEGWQPFPSYPLLNYLHLPHPGNINPAAMIKKHLATGETTQCVKMKEDDTGVERISLEGNDWIGELSEATEFFHLPYAFNGTISWKNEEIIAISEKLLSWWEANKAGLQPLQRLSAFYSNSSNNIKTTALDIGRFLGKTILSSSEPVFSELRTRTAQFFEEAYDNQIAVLPYWVFACIVDQSSGEYSELIEQGLLSSNLERVDEAGRALFYWATLSKKKGGLNPPTKLLDVLVERIIFRKRPGLRRSLFHMATLLYHAEAPLSQQSASLLVSGLGSILELLHIPAPEDMHLEFLKEERPGFLTMCAMVVSTLHQWSDSSRLQTEQSSRLEKIREELLSLNLPEIRRTIEIWGSKKDLH